MKLKPQMSKDYDETIIRPMKGLINTNIKEIWKYRELLITFSWRDIRVRYKQTVLGILWAFIPPVLSMIVFSLIFDQYIETPSNVPYPLFVYTGTLIWSFFSTSLTFSSTSLINNRAMVQKVYFPRVILPFASVIANLLDFSISFFVLILLMIYYQFSPFTYTILLTPILLLITILSILGFGLVLSALNVKYRDINYVLPFIIQMGLFLTPVIYPINNLGNWGFVLWLNPITGVIENARAILLNTEAINWFLLIFSLVISIFYFLIGLSTFTHIEKDFADII